MEDINNVAQGHCQESFEPLRRLFAKRLSDGSELGASLVVAIDGVNVVDLWGGWADEARTRPWASDTITNVWSTTKTMTALSALVLVDRGELDLDAPVARYWPEFAAEGKAEVKVRHVLSHTSGVSGWAQPVTMEDVYDWEKSTSLLAAQAPWWQPGTASGYHIINYGHLVGEIVRRITGRKLGQFFAQEIAAPLGADFHIGLAPSEFERVANVVPPPLPFDINSLDRNGIPFKTISNPLPDATVAWTSAWRQADIGAGNGHGNARSVARIQSAVACGGEIDGIRLLLPKTVDMIFEPQIDGMDLASGVPLKWGLGYALPMNALAPYIPDRKVCFWGGWGGSMVIIDADRRMTIAYVMNKMGTDLVGSETVALLVGSIYACAGR